MTGSVMPPVSLKLEANSLLCRANNKRCHFEDWEQLQLQRLALDHFNDGAENMDVQGVSSATEA